MLLRVSRQIASLWSRDGIIPEGSEEAYVYGIQLLLSTVINVVCIAVISWLMGNAFAWIPFMIGFVPLRMTAGGYHAKTPLRCGITFCGTYTLVLVLLHFLPARGQVPVILINSLVTMTLVFLFSPVPAANKPLTEEEAKRNRKRSLVIAVTSFLFLLIAIWLQFLQNFVLCISCGQVIVAIYLWISKMIQRLNLHESV